MYTTVLTMIFALRISICMSHNAFFLKAYENTCMWTKSREVKAGNEGITNSNLDKFAITIVSHKISIQVFVTPFFISLYKNIKPETHVKNK